MRKHFYIPSPVVARRKLHTQNVAFTAFAQIVSFVNTMLFVAFYNLKTDSGS